MASKKVKVSGSPIDPFSPNYEFFNKIKNSNLGLNKKVTFFGEDELGGFCDLSIFEIGDLKRVKKEPKLVVDDGDLKFSKKSGDIAITEKFYLKQNIPPFALFLTGFLNRQEILVSNKYDGQPYDRVTNMTVINLITDEILSRELAIFYAQKRAVTQLQSGDVDKKFIEKKFKEELASIEKWNGYIPDRLFQNGYFFFKSETVMEKTSGGISSIYQRSLVFSVEGCDSEEANNLELFNITYDPYSFKGSQIKETFIFWRRNL